jgi:hypothetical protein
MCIRVNELLSISRKSAKVFKIVLKLSKNDVYILFGTVIVQRTLCQSLLLVIKEKAKQKNGKQDLCQDFGSSVPDSRCGNIFFAKNWIQ